jgi:hypothetical protein
MNRQVAVAAAGGNQSAVNAAAIAHHKAVIKSGLANGVGVGVNMDALRSLGVGTWQ